MSRGQSLSLLQRGLTAALIALPLSLAPEIHAQSGVQSSSLSRLGAKVAELSIAEANIAVLGPLKNDAASPLSTEARAELRNQLWTSALALVPQARERVKEALSLPDARSLARRRNLGLVYLSPKLDRGTLRIQALYMEWPRSFWKKVLRPEGAIQVDEQLRVPVDASVRRLLPQGSALLSKFTTLKSPVAAPVAVGCGDLDQDGENEVLLVGRRYLAWGTIQKSHFEMKKKVAWSELSPVAGAPLRTPIASAIISDGKAWVGLSDRADLLLLGENLTVEKKLPRAYPIGEDRCLPFSETGLSGPPQSCAQARNQSSSSTFDHYLESRVTEENGTVTQYVASKENGEAAIILERRPIGTASVKRRANGHGSQFVMGDFNGNGTMNLLVSGASRGSSKDRLTLYEWEAEELVLKRSVILPKISSLAVCPFSGENPQSILAIAGGELVSFP